MLHNTATGESFVHHYLTDTNVGRKSVYANCFTLEATPSDPHTIPVYNYYNTTFGGCDKFNSRMHGHTWPFRSGGHGRKGLDGNGFDYLFTAMLVNIFHVWKQDSNLNPRDNNFKACMLELVRGLVLN